MDYIEKLRLEKVAKEPSESKPDLPKTTYTVCNPSELWWCNTHQRKAIFVSFTNRRLSLYIEHCCNPQLGGITMPCSCVNLTGICEITEE